MTTKHEPNTPEWMLQDVIHQARKSAEHFRKAADEFIAKAHDLEIKALSFEQAYNKLMEDNNG